MADLFSSLWRSKTRNIGSGRAAILVLGGLLLLACGNNQPAGQPKDVALVSPWGRVVLRLEDNLIDPRYTAEDLKKVRQIGFFFDTRTRQPTDVLPDADSSVIGIRYEMTAPD